MKLQCHSNTNGAILCILDFEMALVIENLVSFIYIFFKLFT